MSSIQLKEEQYAALPEALQKALKDGALTIEAPKPNKWKPRGGQFVVGGQCVVIAALGASSRYEESGHTYDTEEAAELAAAKIRKYARQLRYVHEHAPGYVVPPIGEKAWFIYQNRYGEVVAAWDRHIRDINNIYMPEGVTKDLARKLKSGEVEF